MKRKEISFSKKGGGGRWGSYEGYRATEVKLPALWWLLFSLQRRKRACGHVQEDMTIGGSKSSCWATQQGWQEVKDFRFFTLQLQLENIVQKKKHCAQLELCPKSNLANWSFSLPLSALHACMHVCTHVRTPTHVHVHYVYILWGHMSTYVHMRVKAGGSSGSALQFFI